MRDPVLHYYSFPLFYIKNVILIFLLFALDVTWNFLLMFIISLNILLSIEGAINIEPAPELEKIKSRSGGNLLVGETLTVLCSVNRSDGSHFTNRYPSLRLYQRFGDDDRSLSMLPEVPTCRISSAPQFMSDEVSSVLFNSYFD